jgi:dTDP-L-rhamnose 4-epimerase
MALTIVTGGLGFIGSHLVPMLRNTDRHVVVLDSLDPDVHGRGTQGPARPEGCEVIHGDVRSSATFDDIEWKRADVVHLAGKTGVGQSMHAASNYADVNCRGTGVLLDHFTRHGPPRRLVLASSRAVYGEGRYQCPRGHTFDGGIRSSQALAGARWDPECPHCGTTGAPLPMEETVPAEPVSHYGATKLFQEHLCKAAAGALGFETVVLRLFNVYGEGQSLWNPYTGVLGAFAVRGGQQQPMSVYEDGRMLRDFVHVSDAIRAIERALTVPISEVPGPVNVASESRVPLLEVAQRIASELQAPAPRVTGKYRLGDVRHVVGAGERARSALGFKPQVGLEDGLAAYLHWFLEQDTPETRDDPRALRTEGNTGAPGGESC